MTTDAYILLGLVSLSTAIALDHNEHQDRWQAWVGWFLAAGIFYYCGIQLWIKGMEAIFR